MIEEPLDMEMTNPKRPVHKIGDINLVLQLSDDFANSNITTDDFKNNKYELPVPIKRRIYSYALPRVASLGAITLGIATMTSSPQMILTHSLLALSTTALFSGAVPSFMSFITKKTLSNICTESATEAWGKFQKEPPLRQKISKIAMPSFVERIKTEASQIEDREITR